VKLKTESPLIRTVSVRDQTARYVVPSDQGSGAWGPRAMLVELGLR